MSKLDSKVRMGSETGFTLIELMLVLAIIAAITVIGISAYQQQLTNFQVDKTALQMQQWLQGATAFYADCGAWPGVNGSSDPALQPQAQLEGKDVSGNPVITCNGAQGKPSGVAYIQSGSIDKNPWGQSYYLITQNPSTNKGFEVSVTNLPSTIIAQRIASRLPMTDTVTTNTVNAYVTLSTQGGGSSSYGRIAYIGQVSSDEQIPNPCLSNETANFYASANTLTAYAYSESFESIKGIGINNVSKDNKYFQPELTTYGVNNKNQIAGNMMLVIITCKNTSTELNQNNNTKQAVAFKF